MTMKFLLLVCFLFQSTTSVAVDDCCLCEGCADPLRDVTQCLQAEEALLLMDDDEKGNCQETIHKYRDSCCMILVDIQELPITRDEQTWYEYFVGVFVGDRNSDDEDQSWGSSIRRRLQSSRWGSYSGWSFVTSPSTPQYPSYATKPTPVAPKPSTPSYPILPTKPKSSTVQTQSGTSSSTQYRAPNSSSQPNYYYKPGPYEGEPGDGNHMCNGVCRGRHIGGCGETAFVVQSGNVYTCRSMDTYLRSLPENHQDCYNYQAQFQDYDLCACGYQSKTTDCTTGGHEMGAWCIKGSGNC